MGVELWKNESIVVIVKEERKTVKFVPCMANIF